MTEERTRAPVGVALRRRGRKPAAATLNQARQAPNNHNDIVFVSLATSD